MAEDWKRDGEAAGAVTTPRWYKIALVVLCALAAVTFLVLGQLAAGIVSIAAAIVMWIVDAALSRSARLRTTTAGPTSRTTNGSSALFGLLFLIIGGFMSLPPSTNVPLGIFFVAFGGLTLGAFLPPLLRERAERRTR